MQPTAKSLVLDLLSSVRGRAMPVRALVAAGALFDISAESMRVALVRLLTRGTIDRDARGQYHLAAAATPVQHHVGTWMQAADRLVAWRDGTWIGVHTAGLPRSDRVQVRRRERGLQLLGLRPLESHLWIRPDNLAGGVDAVRAQLQELGLDATAPVFVLHQLGPATEARARSLWDTAGLRRAYAATCTALARSTVRLAKLAPHAAMVESFVLGGRAIRQIVLDPLLPEPLVPRRERDALIERMRTYDRLGRACWRPFMQGYDAPHLTTPRLLHPGGAPMAAARQ